MDRRVLYIAPFFPPLARAASYTSVKFVRGLARLGWGVDVLSDLWAGAPLDEACLRHIPDTVRVYRSFSGRAVDAKRLPGHKVDRPSSTSMLKKIDRYISRREWLPMGEMGMYMGHATQSALSLAKTNSYDAVIVQATPIAGLEVARRVALETGLPLFGILDDPLGPCELRRPLRPFHTKLVEDWFERRFLLQASHCFLVTDAAREAYRRAHPDLPSSMFSNIHCGVDAEVLAGTGAPQYGFACFTLLFLGSFSNHVRVEHFFPLLRELKARGLDESKLRIVATDAIDDRQASAAEQIGIAPMIQTIPQVPHDHVLELMAAADVLMMSAPTPQRIQAKFYDYLLSPRPILVVADEHPELAGILAATGAGICVSKEEAGVAADFIEGFVKNGRYPVLPRSPDKVAELGSDVSARRVAEVIEGCLENTR